MPKAVFAHLGAHETVNTSYEALQFFFDQVPLRADDIFVDVGCGKGRVMNFLLKKGVTNRIIGIELDPQIAGQTAKKDESLS